MNTTPMCGPTLTPTSRLNPWLSTRMALRLPLIVTAPVGGGIRQGCAEDKWTVSYDATQLPVSANRGSPQTSVGEPKAVDYYPLTEDHEEGSD